MIARRAIRRVLLAAGGLTAAALVAVTGPAQASRPNIIVIQTDDQNHRTVKSHFRGPSGRYQPTMPNTAGKIFGKGTEFRNYYTATPVCSPSRASLLTGQYSHNSGLTGNGGPNGGWEGWRNLPIYEENMPTALQEAGYRTAHVGKFTNGYYDRENDRVDLTIPPGWNRWFTTAYLPGTRYYGYRVNDNGLAVGPFGNPDYLSHGPGIDSPRCGRGILLRRGLGGLECNYLPDVMTRRAVREIRGKKDQPLFLSIDYQAPHGDIRPPEGPQPATRHLDSASRTPIPRPGNFNEPDISDKSPLIQSYIRRRLNQREIGQMTEAYRRGLESLRSVDEGVGAIIRTLRRTGELDNTYIFYLSDHGYFFGAHRFGLAKFLPFEEASRVAMAVRGPGIPRGGNSSEIVGNIDVPATILELAGASTGYQVDGRSLRPFWRDPSKTTRRGFEISMESGVVGGEASAAARTSAGAPALRYKALRAGPYKYVRYAAGQDELYDLDRDPLELRNKSNSPRYAEVVEYMREQLREVDECSGESCRAELPPWPEPGS
ncbi:MAG TPA: sulfatase [Solirubrobacterales bacterium]|nr:sulfatase [Solirubrobacterales bacterium]